MPRTAQKVDDLAEEGEHMTDALGTVLEVAEEEGTVTWADVSDDISSGAWGRLIEKGLLVDAGDGFAVDDPEGAREALENADPSAMGDDNDFSFTTYDKMAMGFAGTFMIGYFYRPVRDAVGETFEILIGPLETRLPFYLVILILALMTGLASALFQDNLMNNDIMGDYQERTQELKERRKKAKERGDDEALEEIQKEQMEMMSDNLGMFKAQFRPMVWIMSVTIPVFLWLRWFVIDVGVTVSSPVIVLPLAGEINAWTTSVVGPMQAWIVWYFVCSMGFGQILRKALNVQTGTS